MAKGNLYFSRKDGRNIMYIILKLDVATSTVYIPDGYVSDPKKLQADFLEWCYFQKDAYIFTKNNKMAVRITSDLFIRYINEAFLRDTNEKAYSVDNTVALRKKAILLHF